MYEKGRESIDSEVRKPALYGEVELPCKVQQPIREFVFPVCCLLFWKQAFFMEFACSYELYSPFPVSATGRAKPLGL